MTGGQFRPQNAPLGGPGSSAGMRYNYPNPRAEAAGYTTSSAFPGAPAGPPTDMSVAGPWGAGMGPPATTGAIGWGRRAFQRQRLHRAGQGRRPLPPPIPPELINPNLNVQTPTSRAQSGRVQRPVAVEPGVVPARGNEPVQPGHVFADAGADEPAFRSAGGLVAVLGDAAVDGAGPVAGIRSWKSPAARPTARRRASSTPTIRPRASWRRARTGQHAKAEEERWPV